MVAQEFASLNDPSGFPSALTIMDGDYGSGFQPRSIMELQIMELEGSIREKAEWWNKIKDTKIETKWHQEIMAQLGAAEGEEEEDQDAAKLVDYQKKQVDFAVAECKWQAELYAKGPVRPAAVDGVFVRQDLEKDLEQKLLQGIETLRSKPAIGADKEDRHPGTPQMVDLVHPSLYCYEKGKTVVLEGVGAEKTKSPEWATFLGKGGIVESAPSSLSTRFGGSFSVAGLQWLPSEFQVNADATSCDINSYINSLHPVQYKDMYTSIGELFCHAVPLLEEVLAEAGQHSAQKRSYDRNSSASDNIRERELRIPIGWEWWEGSPREQREGETDSDYDEYCEEWEEDSSNKKFIKPQVPDFAPPTYSREKAEVNLREKPLQVIVKIASLELKPGESSDGGVWHVEGTLGERIVATACYYLQCENVSGGELSFRTIVSEPNYEQGDNNGVLEMYGLQDEEDLVQDRGSCLTHQGRVLGWPNTHQHRVCPIHLVDPEKPGKRTILCFFLVDPEVRVRSTATVPPQQHAWVAETANPALAAAGMGEKALRDKVVEQLISPSVLTYESACERRKRLMEERGMQSGDGGNGFMLRSFSLCEH